MVLKIKSNGAYFPNRIESSHSVSFTLHSYAHDPHDL